MDPTRKWIFERFAEAKIDKPDGRSLYAYRCSTDAYAELREILANKNPKIDRGESVSQAFAFYAAEWWRRNYSGGPWTWEPILNSIGWHIGYQDLYERLARAWRSFGIDPVVLSGQVRYLGTCASQGGFPLKLVSVKNSKIQRYLRALLREYRNSRNGIEDGFVLAEYLHTYLPTTLRRPPVYRLSADLMDQIWKLKSTIATADDPTAELDQERPGWRASMPVDMDDQHARALIESLLKEASKMRVSETTNFKVYRYLERFGQSYRLAADIRTPRQISRTRLAEIAKIEGQLPARFQLRAGTDTAHVIATGRLQGDRVIFTIHSQSIAGLSGDEVSLCLYAGKTIGSAFVPDGGHELSELPWTFCDREGDFARYDLLAEGSVATRLGSVTVAVLDEKPTLSEGSKIEIWSSNPITRRLVFDTKNDIDLPTKFGKCSIRLNAEREHHFEHQLIGQRSFEVMSLLSIFQEVPRLCSVEEDKPRQIVPAEQIDWRLQGSETWQPTPDAPGVWRIRRCDQGSIMFTSLIGLVDKGFSLELEPGEKENEGTVRLNGVGAASIATSQEGIALTIETEAVDKLVRIRTPSGPRPPAIVSLFIRWENGTTFACQVPFPGRGARFVHPRETDANTRHSLAISSLPGWRIVAVSPVDTDRFSVIGKLVARDLTDSLRRIAHFETTIPRVSKNYFELPLIETSEKLTALFALSKELDAKISLSVVDGSGTQLERTKVRRFECKVKHEASLFWFDCPTNVTESEVSMEAISLVEPGLGRLELVPSHSEGVVRGWQFSESRPINEAPYLVFARQGETHFSRPVLYGHSIQNERDDAHLDLQSAAGIPNTHERSAVIANILAQMCIDDGHEKSWDYLNEILLVSKGLPSMAVHVLEALALSPRLLVRLLLRSGSALRQRVWELESDLPFCWALVPAHIWFEEFANTFNQICVQKKELISKHLNVIAKEAGEYCWALSWIEQIGLLIPSHMCEKRPPDNMTQKPIKGLEALSGMSEIRYQELIKLEQLPVGPHREDWKQALAIAREKPWCDRWRNTDHVGFRRPVLDAPTGAALSAASGEAVSPLLVHSVKLLRAFDPEWFDTAYLVQLLTALNENRGLLDRV